MACGGPPLSRSNGHPGDFPSVTFEEKYQSEAERERSFLRCSLNGIRSLNSKLLASVGFFYTGEGDKVKCFRCGVVYCGWDRRNDIPFNVHKRLNADCPFLQTLSCKRRPPRTQMVICCNTPPHHGRRSSSSASDDYIAYVSTDYQLYRGISFSHSNGTLPIIRSFPASSMVGDPRPVCEDDVLLHSSNFDVTMPSSQPSPAHTLHLQSTETTDHSAILVGNTSKPFKAYRPSAGVQAETSAPVDSFNGDKGREGNTCRICVNAKIECVYLPCGHVGACQSCVDEWKKYSPCCPFCKSSVANTHKIYFP